MDTDLPTLRVMADYECFPLWVSDAGGTDNVDPAALPLSPGLAEKLTRWAEEYDATLDREDPAASGFPSDRDEEAFNDRGRHLARQVAQELAGRYAVQFFDLRLGRADAVSP